MKKVLKCAVNVEKCCKVPSVTVSQKRCKNFMNFKKFQDRLEQTENNFSYK